MGIGPPVETPPPPATGGITGLDVMLRIVPPPGVCTPFGIMGFIPPPDIVGGTTGFELMFLGTQTEDMD